MTIGNAQVDLISQNGGGVLGDVAGRMMQANGVFSTDTMRPWFDPKTGKVCVQVYMGGDKSEPASYRVQAVPIQAYATTLRRDEWITLDQAVLKLSLSRLGGVQDLVSHGLTYSVNGMSQTVLETHDQSNAMNAELSMDGVTRSENDRPVYTATYLPLPLVHVDYQFNARELAVSRNMGNALDTTSAELATRKVLDRLEAMLFTNTSYTWGGGTINSYINYTPRNQVTLTANWDAAGKTGAQIIDDVLNCKQASLTAMHYGPWKLYIPSLYETKLDEDYSTAKGSNTIRERIMAIEGITGIQVIDVLPANNVLLVQMTADTVRLVQGLPIQNIQWNSEGGMVTNFKVMTLQVPEMRSDQDGNCGITHLAA